ncbi:MAG: J domain-containing protein [Pseudomonadota bacterium]
MLEFLVAMAIPLALVWAYVVWPWLDRLHDQIRDHFRPSLDERLEEIRRQADSKGRRSFGRSARWEWQDPKYGQNRTSRSGEKKAEPEKPKTPVGERLAVLGLDEMPDQKTLRHTYRSLVKRWHPDRFASNPSKAERDAAAARMREINEAYDWLCANPS